MLSIPTLGSRAPSAGVSKYMKIRTMLLGTEIAYIDRREYSGASSTGLGGDSGDDDSVPVSDPTQRPKCNTGAKRTRDPGTDSRHQ